MFMFIVPLAFLTFYCHRRLPETRGVSMDTITAQLSQSQPIGSLFACARRVTDAEALPRMHVKYDVNPWPDAHGTEKEPQ
jgi:hypothetical protein